MPDAQETRSSNWFFYFVASALGLSFLVTLMVLAWNNVVEQEVQKFAYESLSLDDTVRTNVRAANNALEGFASLLESVPNISERQIESYADDILERFSFIAAIGVYSQSTSPSKYERVFEGRRTQENELPQKVTVGNDDPAGLGFAAALGSQAPIPTGTIEGSKVAGRYMLLSSTYGTAGGMSSPRPVLAFLIDPTELFGRVAADPRMTVRLFSESEGVGGRQQLFERMPAIAPGKWTVDSLEESTQVRFASYSMRLIAARASYWADLEKGLLFTGLVLGAGVTLLLIALARAKELQARELRERNRVIEDQVQRQTQELAEARDQALEASRVKSDFLASMSHEIRTPLNAIIGMAELLSETQLSGDQQKYVGVFKNAGEALLSLVNDILDLSKIEAEQLVLENIDFDVCSIVEQSADIYALKTASKNIELAAHVGTNVPNTLRGDPSRLRQVILNLIGNAIKFTENGEIIIDVSLVDTNENRVRLLFAVSDTGIGIPVDKLESIFGSFTQVDSSTTRKYGGTGLGLTISKRLVEMMGGRIWVESTEGSGSTFKFEVEIAIANAQVQTDLSGLPSLAGVPILIVDDNDTNLLILREILKAEGAAVVESGSGADAIAIYLERLNNNQPFEVVLCDAQMPGVDGFAVVEEVVNKGGEVRTLMMLTSSNLADDLRRAQAIGLGGYLVKPIKRAELIRAIGSVLEVQNEIAITGPEIGPSDGATRRSILLVEDNPDNRLLIKAYLKREPYDVDEAENGAEALELFKTKPYDLVLMDIQMPIMDGHSATREIRAFEHRSGRQSVPVIALTAHAIKEDMERSIAAGCSAHLTKPIKKQTLLSALTEHLDQ
ncbi:MAG: two-component system sensor histidine kinase/response regulator [Gammaproteobacteria bacterium]|jgi:two-component system sensor histidine kinase/response regulator